MNKWGIVYLDSCKIGVVQNGVVIDMGVVQGGCIKGGVHKGVVKGGNCVICSFLGKIGGSGDKSN